MDMKDKEMLLPVHVTEQALAAAIRIALEDALKS